MDIIKRENRLKINDLNFVVQEKVPLDINRELRLLHKILSRIGKNSENNSKEIYEYFQSNYPDDLSVQRWWDDGSHKNYKNFFVWGHNQDFGNGFKREGAMGDRHVEIIAHGLALGFIPENFRGADVLNVGCWTGGDSILLSSLGANVVNLEEHPVASSAARDLFRLLELSSISMVAESAFRDNLTWKQKFDFIYCSGVIYHVTDPILLLRILFCYLRPGGKIFIETKGFSNSESACSYSGSLEKGWNWFAPSENALGRMLADVGFSLGSIQVYTRANKRILAGATKESEQALSENAGFSRPGSWLEGLC